MKHIILVGDSIFDNKAYVNGPDVIKQVQSLLSDGDKATLRAIDGNVISDVKPQVRNLPPDSTHLVISVGGNNTLRHLSLFTQRVNTVADVFTQFYQIMSAFEKEYVAMLKEVLQHKLPTILCTIYNPNFPETNLQHPAVAALSIFNDCIIRVAISFGLPLIDLRLVCNDPNDYANPIEPSIQGGAKIAKAILAAVQEHNFASVRTEAFV